MSVVGNSSTPTLNNDFSTFTGSMAASSFTMPSPGGLITDLHVYAKTDSGSSASGFLCLWNGSGTLLASVAVTVPASEAFIAGTLSLPVFVASGTGIFIGVQVSGAAGVFIHYDNASSPDAVDVGHNSTIPGNIANFVQHTLSSMGAWADYTPGGAWVFNGSVWNFGQAVVNTGTPSSPVWTNAAEVAANTGSSGSPVWTPGS